MFWQKSQIVKDELYEEDLLHTLYTFLPKEKKDFNNDSIHND